MNNSKTIQENKNKELLTLEKERELIKQSQKGSKEAREELILRNQGLVISIASKYRSSNYNLSLDDYIQAGNIGLMTAIDKFDLSQDTKLSTYAIWWINQRIIRTIQDYGRTIRIPANLHESIFKYKKEIQQLQQELNRYPTPEEIFKKLGYSKKNIERFENMQMELLSLDSTIGEEDKDSLLNFISDDRQNPNTLVMQKSLREELIKVIDLVIPQERDNSIIKYRYGLLDKDPMTLEEIGSLYGLTRERIRQIEEKGLNKIRLSKETERLLSFFSNADTIAKNLEEQRRKEYQTKKTNKNNRKISNEVKKKKKDKQKQKTKEEQDKIISQQKLEATPTVLKETPRKAKNESIGILKTPQLEETILSSSPKEATIALLKLGYVNDTYFSTEDIADFLKIEKQEVVEATKEILEKYKENIICDVDNIIDHLPDKKIRM